MTEVKMPEMAAPKEKLQETDRLALELAKANRKTALANAEKAIAQNETADLAYKYVILQLYMKYGLTEQDAISEQGEILRGGAVKQ
jgi:hypothetical protein